ncbi:MAG: C69 family dipeptidase [Pirellulales bacterium]|nr:C69 family dipeptidase [Pirellulales bacterium]
MSTPRIAVAHLLVISLAAGGSHACTTVLVGRAATADGSVLLATSCDGNIMGRVYVLPAAEYPKGATVRMFYDFPAPSTWQEHFDQVKRGYTHVGDLPIQRTYRCILVAGHLADSITGGINEHGVSMGIEFMPMKPKLANRKGAVSTCSNHWTTSLIANGLMQAKTAREAVRRMGAMAEKFGFTYYWAPDAGCAIPVVDRKEAWIMEIFGPGKDWTPDSGKPGAVWCAQRVPDGEATCNANRSRIGEVDPANADRFLASPNLYLLAEELGLWKRGEPFVWHEVYGTGGERGNSLREWAALSALAPSLRLAATGDPKKDRYPFSVKPDRKVDVQALTAVMRDCYQGTEFDVTRNPAFQPGGEHSPLARPVGSRDLFDLVGVEPERCIATETSGYVYISQIRDGLPAPISGCMWLTLGPAVTSCFAPVYCGMTRITDSWSRLPDFTAVARSQDQWKFQLVEDLTGLKYQEAIQDIRKVRGPAEEQFLSLQTRFEDAAVRAWKERGPDAAAQLVTAYSNSCLEKVDNAYGELVDYLMFRYLYSYPAASPPSLPRIGAVAIPEVPATPP